MGLRIHLTKPAGGSGPRTFNQFRVISYFN